MEIPDEIVKNMLDLIGSSNLLLGYSFLEIQGMSLEKLEQFVELMYRQNNILKYFDNEDRRN
jgi:hypothetical protein